MENPVPFDAQQINQRHMFTQTQSRRRFLRNLALGIGVVATGEIVSGCAKEQDNIWIPENVQQHMDVAKGITTKNPYPRLWRTTASLWSYENNNGDIEAWDGTGSLVKHGEGYGMLSVKHVTDDMSALPYAYMFLPLPEFPITRLEPDRFVPIVTGAADSPVFYPFDSSENAAVKERIRAGLVTPLEFGENEPEPGLKLFSANARLGSFESYRFTRFIDGEGASDLRIVGSSTCEGESGTALLSATDDGERPSNKVYGVIESIDDSEESPENGVLCSRITIASSLR